MKKLSFLQIVLSVQRDLIVGGQAVMEGVMMRTPNAYAIACRKSDGSIVHTAEKLPKWSDKYKLLNIPILRGGAILIQSLALGVKALNYSANVAQEDMEEQEAKEKAKGMETEAALVEGTTDENFTKAPVKRRNFKSNKSKTIREYDWLNNFRTWFQCAFVYRCAIDFDECSFYRNRLGSCSCIGFSCLLVGYNNCV